MTRRTLPHAHMTHLLADSGRMANQVRKPNHLRIVRECRQRRNRQREEGRESEDREDDSQRRGGRRFGDRESWMRRTRTARARRQEAETARQEASAHITRAAVILPQQPQTQIQTLTLSALSALTTQTHYFPLCGKHLHDGMLSHSLFPRLLLFLNPSGVPGSLHAPTISLKTRMVLLYHLVIRLPCHPLAMRPPLLLASPPLLPLCARQRFIAVSDASIADISRNRKRRENNERRRRERNTSVKRS